VRERKKERERERERGKITELDKDRGGLEKRKRRDEK
jgi:hypothetical protein